MRLVNKEKLLAPGKCLVCERIPQGRVVDTLVKNFNNAANDPMRGRKYICDRCGEKIAVALAFKTPQQVSALLENMAELEKRVAYLNDLVNLQETIDRLMPHIERVEPSVAVED